jgi:hypothetical protein
MTSTAILSVAPVVFFIMMMIAGQAGYRRQKEQMKRSKAILDRFSPERSRKPLGL